MRMIVIALTCVLIVGIVLFVVLTAPAPTKPAIRVARIDVSNQPQPIAPSDPAAEHILEFFPDPTEMMASPALPTIEELTADTPPAAGTPGPRASSEEIDRNRLLALIEDWVYVDFSQVGPTKIGRIHQTRKKEYVEIYEGKTLDNGIQVVLLTDDAATLKLGEAAFRLRLALKPAFFDEIKDNWRPITREEQQQAYEYYERIYGDKFREYSKGYKPPAGMPLPRPVSADEREKGRQQYMEMYGNQFMKEAKQFPVAFPGTQEQRENYEKYWQKFHPGLPMPDFDQMKGMDEQLGPGNRIQPSAGNAASSNLPK
ncbi:MAG: hypothetical protein AB1656_02155 [Candidatus Omnitrophota bacterium]